MTAIGRLKGCSVASPMNGRCLHLAKFFCSALMMLAPAVMSFQVMPAVHSTKSLSAALKSNNHDDAPAPPSCWILQEDEIPKSLIQRDQSFNSSNFEWFQSLQRPVLAYHDATEEVILAYWDTEGVLCELRWLFDDFDWRSLLNQEYNKSAFCCDDNLLKKLRRRTEGRAKTQELLSSLRRGGKAGKGVAGKMEIDDDRDDESSQGTLQDLPQIKTLQDYLEESISTADDHRSNPQDSWTRRRVIGPAFENPVSVEEETARINSYFTMRNALEVASYRWIRKTSNRSKENGH